MNASLTATAAAELQDGVELVLKRWTALQMSIVNQLGDIYSAPIRKQLATELNHRLTQSKEKVINYDLENILWDFMLSVLNTEVADGSIQEIAQKLMVMRKECLLGDYRSIQRLRETQAPNVSYASQSRNNDEEDTESDDGDDSSDLREDSGMEIDVPSGNAGPEVVDGWTVVSSKRNKVRRN